ncbi:MAG TPA: hypothetical protein VFQ86_00260 [Arachidicoccus soli]|nr:hypothetical protein [Arachidicoccus soli]
MCHLVKYNKLKNQRLLTSVAATIIILCIYHPFISKAQDSIPKIGGITNHHLSGIVQNDLEDIKKDEKEIKDNKSTITSVANKPLESDPQVAAAIAAYNLTKNASDNFYQTNNNKFPTNSPEYSTASAQQKLLDAKANAARDMAMAAYANAEKIKKEQIDNLTKKIDTLLVQERRSLNELNGILNAGQVLGNLQNNSCLGMFANKTTADIGNMSISDISACLNHVFDGMDLSNKNAFQSQGTGTNFFGISLSTANGNVQIYQDLPINSPSENALRKAAWKYVFSHPEANTKDLQYNLFEKYLKEHSDNNDNNSLPVVIHALQGRSSENIDNIVVPNPTIESPNPTKLEKFGSSVQDIILKLKQYINQSSVGNHIINIVTNVAAVRG